MSNSIFGIHDQNTLDQFADISSRATKTALMADGHFGYIMPVGGVAGYDNKVSVPGVGFDIACGNCAIKTDITLADLMREDLTVDDIDSNPSLVTNNKHIKAHVRNIRQNISFGIGRKNLSDDAPVDHSLFLDPRWYIVPNIGRYRDDLKDRSQRQLGTIGSGNHYVDVFVDYSDGSIWVGVHFGSRGLGHTIASNFLAISQGGTWGDKAKEVEALLDLSTQAGKDYWDLMELCGDYAYAGREWVTKKVVELIGGTPVDMVHNHHNFAWKEKHWVGDSTRDLVVIRKGATPAFPYQRGFVGGSMGDNAVILQGSDEYEVVGAQQEAALFSTVHGAGRVMSRTEAAGKRDRKSGQLKKDKVTGEVLKAPKVTKEMMDTWTNQKGVFISGGGVDESPHVYRRLTDVLAAQGDTIEVLNVLRPVIVCMADATEFDPYSD